MAWTYFWAGSSSDQPRYDQFQHGGCAVGCGPVAWGILFAWADRQASNGNAYWAPRWGLYRVNGGRGANVIAPIGQDNGVDNMIRELNGHLATFCIIGSGATFPWDMPQASRYVNGRSGTRLSTHWNSLGIHRTRLANHAAESIAHRRTPAIIGTGWLTHYPVAWGYAWQRRVVRHSFLWWDWEETVTDTAFYVNFGWGGGGAGEWIDASSWFSGEIHP